MEILNSKPNKFWTQNEQLETQRLYIQFTLLASAISDFAVGVELQNNSRLNWSTSAFYYSMVHSGRFIVFSCLGDFPTGHTKLIAKIKGKGELNGDWLQYFKNPARIESIRENTFNDQFYLENMIEFYNSLGFCDFKERLRQFGEIIDKSKKLREDSNYESLLIAHEFDHEYVSSKFEDLTQYIRTGCETSLHLINKGFECFVNNYPFQNILSEDVKGFINYYIDKRILKQLRERRFSNIIVDRIEKILGERFEKTSIDPTHFKQMENNISFDIFNMKTDLMKKFSNKIRELDIATRLLEIERERQREVENRIEKMSISLFNAINNKDINAILELRKKGADPNHKNSIGLTCLELAKAIGIEKITNALTQTID